MCDGGGGGHGENIKYASNVSEYFIQDHQSIIIINH